MTAEAAATLAPSETRLVPHCAGRRAGAEAVGAALSQDRWPGLARSP